MAARSVPPLYTPIPAAVIEENRSQLGEKIHLPSLLPLLKRKAIHLPSILDSAELSDDFKTAHLLRHVTSSGQHVVNLFLEALHDDKRSQTEALHLLDEARLEYKKRYPVSQVLDDIRPRILNVATLIPYLMKEGVLTTEHYHDVSSTYVNHEHQVGRLLTAVKARGIKGLATFVKCLRRIDEYTVLAKDLTEKVQYAVNQLQHPLPLEEAEALRKLGISVCDDDNGDSGTAPDTGQVERTIILHKPAPVQMGKRLLVLLSMESYADIGKEKGMATLYSPPSLNGKFEEYRSGLIKEFTQLGFVMVNMTEILSSKLMNDNSTGGPLKRAKKVADLFEEHVARRCLPDAMVVIYISGTIFPIQAMQPVIPAAGSGRAMPSLSSEGEELSTALLLQGAPRFSRDSANCLREEELKACFNVLPTPYVTIIADCHLEESPMSHNFEVWSRLCSWRQKPRSVVFFSDNNFGHSKNVHNLGLMTMMFVEELTSWIKREQPKEITHRLFHQSISLRFHYWKEKQKEELTTLSCALLVQGDVDRQFLGPQNYPPSLLFHGCHSASQTHSPFFQSPSAESSLALTRTEEGEGADIFCIRSVPLACGKVLGLSEGEPVQVYHVCQPEQKFTARLHNVKLLSSIARLDSKETQQLQVCLKGIYEDDLRAPVDLCTLLSCICVCGTIHDPIPVSVDDPSAEEQLLDYIQKMLLVKYSYDIDKTIICVKRAPNIGYEIGLEEHHAYDDMDDLSTDSLVVSNVEQARTIIALLASGCLLRKLTKNIVSNIPPEIGSTNPFECLIYRETDLLTSESLHYKTFSLNASSFTYNYPPVGVLGKIGEKCFWSPSKDELSPYLLVSFQRRRHISLIELRGDIEHEENIPNEVKIFTSKAIPGYPAPMKPLTTLKMNSVWPQTVNFVSPVLVGEIRFEPIIFGEKRPIFMQLQVKGNSSPEGDEVMVYEGDMFRILFLNYHNAPVYVNALILEQTGSVNNVWKSHRISPSKRKDESTILPTVAEKLVKATMPHDLHEEVIRDTYKIIVSTHPLDLSSLEVHSPYEYFGHCHQFDFSAGSRGILDMPKMENPVQEWCYCTEMHVKVRRRNSRTFGTP